MSHSRKLSWTELLGLVCLGLVCTSLAVDHFENASEAQAGLVEAAQSPDSAPAAPSGQAQTYDGIVTDTKCGAKHTASARMDAADCARACVHGGQEFALVDGDKMFTLKAGVPEMQMLKKFAGERVQVKGSMNGSTISVVSVQGPPS